MNVNELMRYLLPIRNGLYHVMGRAVLTAVDNSGKSQKVQLAAAGNEVIDKVERLQEYGLETNPPIGDSSEVVIVSIGGQRDMSFVIKATAREYRPKTLTAGEVMIYSKFGQQIHLKSDGSVLVKPAAGKDVLLYDAGGSPVMLETVIDKINNHKHKYTPGTGAPVDSSTMTAALSPTTLMAGTDSATHVKAKA